MPAVQAQEDNENRFQRHGQNQSGTHWFLPVAREDFSREPRMTASLSQQENENIWHRASVGHRRYRIVAAASRRR